MGSGDLIVFLRTWNIQLFMGMVIWRREYIRFLSGSGRSVLNVGRYFIAARIQSTPSVIFNTTTSTMANRQTNTTTPK